MLIRHLMGYLPAQAAGAIAAFGGVAVFTRLMEPAAYGRLSLALAAVAFAHMTLFTWLEAAVARRYAAAEAKGELRFEAASALALYAAVATGVGLVGAVLILALPLGPETRTLASLALGVLIVRSAFNLALVTRKAARQVRRSAGLESAHALAGFFIGAGVLAFTPAGAAGPLAGLLAAAAGCLLIEAPGLIGRARAAAPSPARMRMMFGYGAAVSASLALHHTLAVGDRFLIAAFLGQAATGVYAAGYALGARFLDVFFAWAGMAAGPLTVAALEIKGPVEARAIARRNAETLALIALPATVGLMLVAGPLAGVLVGEAFREEAARIIPWVALGGLFSGLTIYYFQTAFMLAGRSGRMAAAMLGPAALNVALNLVLLPRVGVIGAAWATAAAYGAGLLVCAVWGRRWFALPIPWATAGGALGASAIMALAVASLPDLSSPLATLALHAGAGALVYGALVWGGNLAGCRGWLAEARA